MSNEFYIGRQPILDINGEIYAYELLFRQSGETTASVTDNSGATARVLVNAIQNIGLSSLLGNKKGFINADEKTIMEGTLDILPKKQFVIEILETTKVDEDIIERINDYRVQGYSFALDDLVLSKEYYNMFGKLFNSVDVIKVDFMLCDREMLKKNMSIFKKTRARLLAEKVETIEDYEFCKEIGFDLFQGYYFSKPVIIKQQSVDPSKAATVQLINMLKEDKDAGEIEKMIKSYPDLYINLLKFMNSAMFYTKGNVTSIKHAMALLGRENLSKWLYLILYAGPNNDSFDNPLLKTAQTRAKLMEKMCQVTKVPKEKAGSAYLVGLLSLMDVVFNKELKELMKEFNIGSELKEAVVDKKGELGFLLETVNAYEKDDVSALQSNFEKIGLSFDKFNEIMLETFEYVENTV